MYQGNIPSRFFSSSLVSEFLENLEYMFRFYNIVTYRSQTFDPLTLCNASVVSSSKGQTLANAIGGSHFLYIIVLL